MKLNPLATAAHAPGRTHITHVRFAVQYLTIACPVCCAPCGRDCKNNTGLVAKDRKVHQERQHAYSALAGTARKEKP